MLQGFSGGLCGIYMSSEHNYNRDCRLLCEYVAWETLDVRWQSRIKALAYRRDRCVVAYEAVCSLQ